MQKLPPKHILIVDDESSLLELFKTLFDGEGYRLTFVETGRDAVSVLQKGDVDLVITDKNLHDVNGLEILRIAKKIQPLTEVIIVTGYASLDTVLEALQYDAFDYMLKPLNNIFDVRNRVRLAIEKQNIVIENQRLLRHLQEKTLNLEQALEERKRVESQLIQSEKLAGIGTLASGVAHEISSPLFGILGLSEAIVDEHDLESIHRYANEIVEYSKQIREIVQDLSAYSRSAKPDGEVSVDVRRCVEDAVRLVGRSRRMEGVTLQVDIEPGLLVRARSTELQQVFVNLLKNAIDAFDNDEEVERRVRVVGVQDEQEVRIEVSDTGFGIAEDQIERIFDPFFTTKDVGKGTGLGLNVVFRIVTRYDGQISVESTPNQGTTFTVRFPRLER